LKLKSLIHRQQLAKKELETSQALWKEKTTKLIKGEDLFQDIEFDQWKVKVNIVGVKRDLTNLGKQRVAIQQ
jgi:hypothetical protein